MKQTSNPIQQALQYLTIAQESSHAGLTVHPLTSVCPADKDYLTLDEALASHSVVITEVSDSGSVPELLLRNGGKKAVFLLDGEELVGAKQNRILNISVLAPAMKDTIIPVSCVEAGRWRHTSHEFKSAPRTQFSASRARRSARVSENMAATGMRYSDQGEVWNDISEKLSSLGSHSETQAVESAFADHESTLNGFVEKLAPVDAQVGAVFSINGRVTGMELFDCHQTCRELMPKIIRSYALDAIDSTYRDRSDRLTNDSPATPQELLARVGSVTPFVTDAIGEGLDLRIRYDSGLTGGALVARDRVIHLAAFVIPQHGIRSSDRIYRRHVH